MKCRVEVRFNTKYPNTKVLIEKLFYSLAKQFISLYPQFGNS